MNIHEKLKNGYYVSEVKFPLSVPKSCPECGIYAGASAKFCPECGFDLAKHKEEQIWERAKLIKLHNQENKDKRDLFKKDALDEVGLTNHPKADKIFSYAWDKGHSSGFREVLSELQDLAELF